MLNKNNLKYIFILAIGFFWCSAVYLTQQTYMLAFCDKKFVNVVAILYGSFSMALGILLYMLTYKKSKNLKAYYALFSMFAIISSISFFGANNKIFMSICLCLTCLFGTAGFGVGYHFSLLAYNIEKEYRGRVFAIGYGLGSILTYLFAFLPIKFYSSIASLFVYIPVILLNIVIVYKDKDLIINKNESYTKNYKKYFIGLSILVLTMSLLSALSTDVVSTHIFDMDGLFANTRIYYCLGLLLAGYLVDKKKEFFDIATLMSFVFSLLSIVLLNQKISPIIVIAFTYFFVGFFVVFRTLTFVNLYDQKRGTLYLCAIGLMYSRIMEGVLLFFQKELINNYTLLIIVEAIILCLVLWIYFLNYLKNNYLTPNDKLKELVLKYKLSNQEEKVLRLLIQDYTKKEIADNLYLSVNTIKIHVTNIYKKTGMSRVELKEKCILKAE